MWKFPDFAMDAHHAFRMRQPGSWRSLAIPQATDSSHRTSVSVLPSERDNIYVFIDEAHRSVAKDLGSYLMAAVPNATIIGFTGTPVHGKGKGGDTASTFGRDDELGFTHKYSSAESVRDKTTLPIRHVLAPGEMVLPTEHLEKEFFSLAATEGITDIEELNAVLERAVNIRAFLSSDDHIEEVAAFVAQHFQEKVLPLGYKAFLVASTAKPAPSTKKPWIVTWTPAGVLRCTPRTKRTSSTVPWQPSISSIKPRKKKCGCRSRNLRKIPRS